MQLIDLDTHNFAIPGSRATGNDGSSLLIADQGWHGDQPADIDNVTAIQAQYVYLVQPRSAFHGQAPRKTGASIEYPRPLIPITLKTSLAFYEHLNANLQFCPTHSSEPALKERFANIGVGVGLTFEAGKLSP